MSKTCDTFLSLMGREFKYIRGRYSITILFNNEGKSTNYVEKNFKHVENGINHFIVWALDYNKDYVDVALTNVLNKVDTLLKHRNFQQTLNRLVAEHPELETKDDDTKEFEVIVDTVLKYVITEENIAIFAIYVDYNTLNRENSKTEGIDIEQYLNNEEVFFINVFSIAMKIAFLVYMYKPSRKFIDVASAVIHKFMDRLYKVIPKIYYEGKLPNSTEAIVRSVRTFEVHMLRFITNLCKSQLRKQYVIMKKFEEASFNLDGIAEQIIGVVMGALYKFNPVYVDDVDSRETFIIQNMYNPIQGTINERYHYSNYKLVNKLCLGYTRKTVQKATGNVLKNTINFILSNSDGGEDSAFVNEELELEHKDVVLFEQSKQVKDDLLNKIEYINKRLGVDSEYSKYLAREMDMNNVKFDHTIRMGENFSHIDRNTLTCSLVFNVISAYGGSTYVYKILTYTEFCKIVLLLNYRIRKLGNYNNIADALISKRSDITASDKKLDTKVSAIMLHLNKNTEDTVTASKIVSIISNYYETPDGRSVVISDEYLELLKDDRYVSLFEVMDDVRRKHC